MATFTSPDNIYKPDSTDQVTPLETPFNLLANSVQTALDKREVYSYRWADASERNATTGMRAGDTGYQADEDTVYRRVGSSWKVWERPEKTYVPIATNLNVGTGGSAGTDARYMVSGGMVFVQIRSTLGTSGFSVGNVLYSVPLTMDTSGLTGSGLHPLGQASLFDTSGTTGYVANVFSHDANTVRVLRNLVSGANVVSASITSTAPFTWAAGDTIRLWFSYRISL
jgi:hypothetical protein